MEGYKKCPFCANEIKEEAIKCQYCHEFLDKENVTLSVNNSEISENIDYKSLQKSNKLGKLAVIGSILLMLIYISLPLFALYSYTGIKLYSFLISCLIYIFITIFILIGVCKHNRIFGLSLIIFTLYNFGEIILKRGYGTLTWSSTTTVRVVRRFIIFIVSLIGVIYIFKYNRIQKKVKLSKKEKVSIIFFILLCLYITIEIVHHFLFYYN